MFQEIERERRKETINTVVSIVQKQRCVSWISLEVFANKPGVGHAVLGRLYRVLDGIYIIETFGRRDRRCPDKLEEIYKCNIVREYIHT